MDEGVGCDLKVIEGCIAEVEVDVVKFEVSTIGRDGV